MGDLSPEYVFFKMPLYQSVKVTEDNFKEFELIMRFSQGGGQYERNKVEGNNPFLGNKPTTFVGWGHPGGEDFEYIIKYGGLRGTSIKCVRDGNVLTYYFHFDVTTNLLMKVGQFPSVADFQIQDIKKYRTVLSKEKLREFSKAIGLAANGVGIGSFVYLRRIFEDLIDDAYTTALKDRIVDAEGFRKARMDDRISMLKDYLPSFLLEHKSLYGILSVGIHELSEDDCLDYFETIKVGIEQILDEKIENLRKAEGVKEASKKISALTQKIKGLNK